MNILNEETILELFRENYLLFVGCLFVGTFALTFYLIPKVLWVSKEKNLMAPVNGRSAHALETPSFGGVAFYITLILLLCIIQSLRLSYTGNHLIAAITVLFMVGLKDDLVISTARVKLFGQIAATAFLVFSPELQLTNLYGFWGIHEIPEPIGYFITAFVVVAIINAYNLIDGIDGLAAMAGMLIAGVFSGFFYFALEPYYVLVSITGVGILAAFLRFNFSRGGSKIFMGDSGSLIMGLLLAFLTLKLLVMQPSPALTGEGFLPANRLLLIACILFLPAFDTIRVMAIRLINGRSPFSADRNHAHHVLLDYGCSHLRASLILVLTNLLIITLYILASNRLPHLWLNLFVISLYGGVFLLLGRLKTANGTAVKPATVKAYREVKTPTKNKVKLREREEAWDK